MKHLYELLRDTPIRALSNMDYDNDYLYIKKILIRMSNTDKNELDSILNKVSKRGGFKSLTREELITLIELFLGKILSEAKDSSGKKFLYTVGINKQGLLYTTTDLDYLQSCVKYLVHYYKIYFYE